MPIRIVEGLDIPIEGTPAQVISDGRVATSVALLGNDYPGLRPLLQVQKGDRIKLGQSLFADRRHPDIRYTSPGSGIVTEINRGARRALLSLVVSLDGDDEETFPCWPERDLPALRRDQVRDTLLTSGQWTAFRTRPYGKVPDAGTVPHSIFVTAMNSEPLAARPEVVIEERPADFSNGLTVISHLTEGRVFVCKAPYADLPEGPTDRVSVVEFSGPHPSGLVGTHIHFLDPVGTKKIVWHLNYQDVIAIGKLFTTGRIWTERIVALAGPMVREPRLIRARLGADIAALTRGELAEGAARIISGSVLSGRATRRSENYLGRFHTQVSVIPEAQPSDDRNSADTAGRGFSTYNLSVSRMPHKRKFALTTALHGRPTAMVPLGQFEWVMPLDILPTQLLRALLVGDTDMAQALGCLELVEEDLALCSFVCPSKLNYGPILKEALEHIEREG